MSGWVRNRFPEHLVPGRLRSRYLATRLTRRRLARQSFSILLASVVALWTASIVEGARATRAAWGRSRPVVLMASTVEAGDLLAPKDLRIEQVPLALVPDDAVFVRRGTSADSGTTVPPEIIGRRTTARLGVGRMLTTEDLEDPTDGTTSSGVAPGDAAVTLELVPRMPPLEPGGSVDVYGAYEETPRAVPARTSDAPDSGGRVSDEFVPAAGRGSMTLLVAHARVRDVDDRTITLVVPESSVVAVLNAAETGRMAFVISG